MLDQSFSAKNFRTIFDISNRNGLFVEDKLNLTTIKSLTNDIKSNADFAKFYKKLGNEKLNRFFIEIKENNRQIRNNEIDRVLEEISFKIAEKNFKLELKQIKIPGGKDLYTIDNKSEYFFALKQVQYNISRLFGVKQANRNSIVEQLLSLLNDKFPKTIIRTDISSFYESIDHEIILRSVNGDNLLSPKSRKIIHNILHSYKKLSGNSDGVPRGIGVSAYLSELYMRKIDEKIRSISGVTYYARFVDDIIIIFTPYPNEQSRDYLKEIKIAIEDNNSIIINPSKTFRKDILDSTVQYTFEYLGYEYQIHNGKVRTKLTNSKFEKIKTRLILAFEDYKNTSKISEKKARKVLVKRIRFLTGNTRLVNNKSKILIGIYHSNRYLTEMNQIKTLDAKLKNLIHTNLASNSLKIRLDRYNFLEGFQKRRFSPFNAIELKEIMNIWK